MHACSKSVCQCKQVLYIQWRYFNKLLVLQSCCCNNLLGWKAMQPILNLPTRQSYRINYTVYFKYPFFMLYLSLFFLGVPLNVVNFPTSSTIISLHFLPAIKTKDTTNQSHQWKNTPPPAKLLACSESGGLHIVEYNQEDEGTVSNLYSR